jgi:hypothetical protein
MTLPVRPRVRRRRREAAEPSAVDEVAKQVRIWPPFYNRFAAACTVDQEVEIIGRHLGAISERFAQGWDSDAAEDPKPVPGRDDHWRFLVVMLDGGPLAAIYARERPGDPDTVEIRNITVTPPP